MSSLNFDKNTLEVDFMISTKSESTKTRMGIVQISYEILRELLNLPSDIRIIRTKADDRFDRFDGGGTLNLILSTENPEHTLFKVVQPGELIPHMGLSYISKLENGKIVAIEPVLKA